MKSSEVVLAMYVINRVVLVIATRSCVTMAQNLHNILWVLHSS